MRARHEMWIVLIALLFVPKMGWGQTTVPITNPSWSFSPYNWNRLGSAEIVANEPGAYFSMTFSGSSQAVLNIDTLGIPTANGSATVTTMVVQWSIDSVLSSRHTLLLSDTSLPLATGLTSGTHTLQFWFTSSNDYANFDYKNRWTRSVSITGGYSVPAQSLRIASMTLSSGATVSAPTLRPKRALFFGDSITEGAYTMNSSPTTSDARQTYAAACAQQLNAEYGSVGNAGQGWAKSLSGSGVPVFPTVYSQFYDSTPRFPLPAGTPDPDYVFLNMGTNDDLNPRVADATITSGAQTWLQNIRSSLSTSQIFLVVPFDGAYATALTTAYNNYIAAHPTETKMALLNLGSTAQTIITAPGNSSDGIHPYASASRALGFQLAAAAQTALGRSDLNGDGLSDLILQNTNTNQIGYWFMNGATIQNTAPVSPVPFSGYKIVGSADFNGDGKPDLVFQNTSTGAIVIWYMDGTNYLGGALVSTTPASGYKVVGVGDFNGDGQADLVFQNQTTNQIVFWFMSGATVVGGSALPAVPSAGYQVVGTGDFNRDGQTDLLFQDSVSGVLVIWYMSGVSYLGGAAISSTPSTGYLVQAVVDLDRDGRPDIVFSGPNGAVVYWRTDDANYLSGGLISGSLGSAARIVGPR